MAASQPPPTEISLYKELSDHIAQGDHRNALICCDKLLEIYKKDDPDALHCRVIALMSLGRWNDSVEAIEKMVNVKKQTELQYERAYCLFRLRKFSNARI